MQALELHATSPIDSIKSIVMSTQNNHEDDTTTMELTNPVADPRIVDKLAKWLLEKKPWAYTGHKSTRSNAKPKLSLGTLSQRHRGVVV